MEKSEKIDKIVENIMKIRKASGFHIISTGENPCTWNLEGSFYFDNESELNEFRNNLKKLYTDYCGSDVSIETFEERNARRKND